MCNACATPTIYDENKVFFKNSIFLSGTHNSQLYFIPNIISRTLAPFSPSTPSTPSITFHHDLISLYSLHALWRQHGRRALPSSFIQAHLRAMTMTMTKTMIKVKGGQPYDPRGAGRQQRLRLRLRRHRAPLAARHREARARARARAPGGVPQLVDFLRIYGQCIDPPLINDR